MIKVLVVEDSAVVREFLVQILNADPQIQVSATANNGTEALAAVMRQKPDVITMDIHMPGMDGFEASRQIMETHPTPIVIVSGSEDAESTSTPFKALEAGALAVVARPKGIHHPNHALTTRELVQTVKLMSEVKVVRRWARAGRTGSTGTLKPSALDERSSKTAEVKLVAIGASTGGPLVLQTILAGLPKDFSIPVLIVQHMAAGFLPGFVDWLSLKSTRPVHLAARGDYPQPGHIYVAPDGFQMKVEMGGRISLTTENPENGLRPAVSALFRSVATVYGPNAVGILLTGMGRDGAEELKKMHDRGALTIAQDEASSVVHGMPGEAIKLGAATFVLSPTGIVAVLQRLGQTQ